MSYFVPKLRINRQQMAVAINWYAEQFTLKYGSLVYSEAGRELMRREFDIVQAQKRNAERTNVWLVPLKLDFLADGNWQVSIADESLVLFLN